MPVTLAGDIESINSSHDSNQHPGYWQVISCILSCRYFRSWTGYKWFKFICQLLHAAIALGFVVVGIIEFINKRPFFDALAHHELPEQLFHREFLGAENAYRRFMDAPILLFFIFYFGVCAWNRFTGKSSWLMTIALSSTTLIYLYINLWNQHDFNWKYFISRFNGIFIQVYTMSFTMALVLTVFLAKRRRLPFKFKAHFPLYTYSTAHVIWNLIALFVVMSTCLVFWISRLYISWVCVESLWKISLLCQVTPEVQCYLCDQCIDSELKRCAANVSNVPLHCYHPISTSIADKSAFCTFNYNIGVFTFITVFAYVGGLWVFLHGFLSALLHYTVILGKYILYKARKRFAAKRSGVLLFENDFYNITGDLDDTSSSTSENSRLNCHSNNHPHNTTSDQLAASVTSNLSENGKLLENTV